MQALDPGREYLVLASSIPPLSRSSTGRLFGAPVKSGPSSPAPKVS